MTSSQQSSSGQTNTPSSSLSSGVPAHARAVERRGSRTHTTSRPPPPVRFTKHDIPRYNPMHPAPALESHLMKSVSRKEPHPAYLTPSYQYSSSQETLHKREKVSSGSLAAYAHADNDSHPTLEMAARELSQQSVPVGFDDSAGIELSGLSGDAQLLAGTPLHPRPMLGTHKCRASPRAYGSKG